MVNVPTGVWIDENGVIVRPNETAYTRDNKMTFGGKDLVTEGSKYVQAVRDWVEKGAESEYALTPEEVAEQIRPRTNDQALAEANFQLGVHFHQTGNEEKANLYWEKAQELRPESWNYHRQDWSFTPQEAMTNWLQKFRALGDEPYYPPLKLDSE